MKRLPGTLLALPLIALFAAPAGAAGFDGPGSQATITRASEVAGARDETPCILEGRIIEKLPRRKNRYLFEDRSGQVVVEIKRRVFGDETVTPGHLVRISGEVESDGRYPNEVEAEFLRVIGTGGQYGN